MNAIIATSGSSTNVMVGMTVTCQMGNSFDSSGYEEFVPVKILDVKDVFGTNVYLIADEKETYVGTAILSAPYEEQNDVTIYGDMYCTTRLPYGQAAKPWTNFKTKEAAMKYLGF